MTGLERVLDATEVAAWAEGAMARAEGEAKFSLHQCAFLDVFGEPVEVKWNEACCIHEGPDCRPSHYSYWHAGKWASRDEVLACMVEAALESNRNVEAAMEAEA